MVDGLTRLWADIAVDSMHEHATMKGGRVTHIVRLSPTGRLVDASPALCGARPRWTCSWAVATVARTDRPLCGACGRVLAGLTHDASRTSH